MTSRVMHRRRKTRIMLSAPLLVTSVDGGSKMCMQGDTVDVSSNGCLLRLKRPILLGTRLRLDLLGARQCAQGTVVRCDGDGRRWNVGIQLLQQSGNFWGVLMPPEDWNSSCRPSDENEIRWYG